MYRFILPALLLIGGTAALSADTEGYDAWRDAEQRVKLDKALAGLVPGKAQSCLHQFRDSYITERYGDTILYRRTRGEVYRVDTGGGCFGRSRGDAIITRSPTGDLCRGAIVRPEDLVSHMPSGSCSFGDFIPYRRP